MNGTAAGVATLTTVIGGWVFIERFAMAAAKTAGFRRFSSQMPEAINESTVINATMG